MAIFIVFAEKNIRTTNHPQKSITTAPNNKEMITILTNDNHSQ